MLDQTLPLLVRETVIIDEPGFLYCFLTSYKAQKKGYNVVKVGCSKSMLTWLSSHKSIWQPHKIMLLTHTDKVKKNEKIMIDYFKNDSLTEPFYDPKTKKSHMKCLRYRHYT